MDNFYHNKRYHSCSYVTKVEPKITSKFAQTKILDLLRLKEPKKKSIVSTHRFPSRFWISQSRKIGQKSTRQIRTIFRRSVRLTDRYLYWCVLRRVAGWVAGRCWDVITIVIMGWVAGGCWDVYYYSDYGSFPHSLQCGAPKIAKLVYNYNN